MSDWPFWTGAALLTALAVMALLAPLLRRRGADPAGRAAYDLAVYRDQLEEIGRDLARGVLSAAEAQAARLEVERRILAAAGPSGAGAGPRRLATPRWVAAALATLLPLASLLLYVGLGAPGLPGAPAEALRAAASGQAGGGTGTAGEDQEPDMASLVDELARRMADRPEDVRGWLLLARSYGSIGRYADSAEAYAAAIARGAADGPHGAEVQSAYGEALTAAADGEITLAARAAFAAALARDPGDPRARFYLALAQAQAGDLEAALAEWLRLEAEAPAEAPWRAAVSEQIEHAAAQLGRDAASLPGRAPPPAATDPGSESGPESGPAPGPDAADMAAAAEMTPEARDAFIRGMVERLAGRLADDPDDIEGWLRLARAYGVLGEAGQARDAWARAAALAPDRADVLLSYAQALREAHSEEAPLPPEFAAAVARARALEPDNPLGLYLGGLAATSAGNPAGARALWERLLALLPEGSPERAEVEALLATLPAS